MGRIPAWSSLPDTSHTLKVTLCGTFFVARDVGISIVVTSAPTVGNSWSSFDILYFRGFLLFSREIHVVLPTPHAPTTTTFIGSGIGSSVGSGSG